MYWVRDEKITTKIKCDGSSYFTLQFGVTNNILAAKQILWFLLKDKDALWNLKTYIFFFVILHLTCHVSLSLHPWVEGGVLHRVGKRELETSIIIHMLFPNPEYRHSAKHQMMPFFGIWEKLLNSMILVCYKDIK